MPVEPAMSPNKRAGKILVVYNAESMHVNTTKEFVSSFGKYSQNYVFYCQGASGAVPDFNPDEYDAIIISYCCGLMHYNLPSQAMRQKLREFNGLKAIILQDEYTETELRRQAIIDLGISLVFTNVPQSHIDLVYPPERFRHVRFVTVLTGYVPDNLSRPNFIKPLAQRDVHVGYRGRRLGAWFGELGFLKSEIGRQVRRACRRRSIPCDIEWSENARIYGEDWFRFLGNCRAVLGIETGSNVFDENNLIRRRWEELKQKDPRLTFRKFRPELVGIEGKIPMAQISARIFEAISMYTPMILIEGRFSDAIEPNKHYIPLKQDFSNIHEVLDQLEDLSELEMMAQRAYQDVISSGRWSYAAFVDIVDRALAIDGKAISPHGGMDMTPKRDHPLRTVPTPQPLTADDWAGQIQNCAQIFRPLKDGRRRLAGRCYIYGSGEGGRLMACHLPPSVKVAGFIDTIRSGRIGDLPLLSLDQFSTLEDLEDCNVLVASQYFLDIAGEMLRRRLDRRVRGLFDATPLMRRLLRQKRNEAGVSPTAVKGGM